MGQPLPTLDSFSAVQQNGGIKLTYAASNFPASLCRWGRVKITRYAPNGQTKRFYLYANQVNFIYDLTGDLNTTYDYVAEIYIAYT